MTEHIIKDSKELQLYLTKDLKEVQREYGEKMLKKLKEIEKEYVYDKQAIALYQGYATDDTDGTPQWDRGFWMYDRTEDLYNLFKMTFKGSNQYRSIMSIIPVESMLSHCWEEFQHDSNLKKGGELSAEGYLDIIEHGLPERKSMFGRIEPRPFWEEFLNEMDESIAKGLYLELLRKRINIYKAGAEIS